MQTAGQSKKKKSRITIKDDNHKELMNAFLSCNNSEIEMLHTEHTEEEREFGGWALSEVISTEINNHTFVAQQPLAGKEKCKATLEQFIKQ